MENIYVHSITTAVFTKEGDIVVFINKNKQLDTLPQYFMGKRENNDFFHQQAIEVLDKEEDYRKAVSSFFGAKSKLYSTYAKENSFFLGNEKALIDCGKLHSEIRTSQILEMKQSKTPSFIRAKNDIFEMTVEGKNILNEIQTRYLIIPELTIEEYENLQICPVEELEEIVAEDTQNISSQLLWQMSGESLEEIKKFSTLLKKIVPFHKNKK